jgi:ectoine hydroxylase-related dioxygenase (phytanoyl-CoA dioxygenase family)
MTHVSRSAPDLAALAWQGERFDESGVAVLRGHLSPAQTAGLAAEIDRLGRVAAGILREADGDPRRLASGELVVVPEAADPLAVCRYENIAGASGVFRELVAEALLPAIGALVGEPCVLFKDKLNEKSPGGGAFPPHQDFAAYRHFPPRYNATAMVPVDPMTELNGCVQFSSNYRSVGEACAAHVEETVEGRPLFRTYGPGPRNGDIVDEVQERLDWHPVEAAPGDVVFFDSFVPHMSIANASRTRRRALFITFSRAVEGDWYDHYYKAKRGDSLNPMFHVSTPTVHTLSRSAGE